MVENILKGNKSESIPGAVSCHCALAMQRIKCRKSSLKKLFICIF
jgi:hypothetical protein